MRPPPAPRPAPADATFSSPAPGGVAVAEGPLRGRAADYKELLKPGISGFVTATAAAGYLLGAAGPPAPVPLVGLLVGTALTAGGSGALNHLIERDLDARMERTRGRPLPAGRVRPGVVLVYGLALVGAGLGVLGATTNALTTGLALATVALYVFAYPPLKRRTVHNTLVGAVPGALPILGGVTAATGALDAVGAAVFALLFLWQLPHFYALAWMYRADYARGGFRMLPGVEPSGRATGALALVATLALLVVGLLPTALGAAGWLYLVGMAGLGTAFTLPAFAFFSEPNDGRARRLLLASIFYVPVFLALVVVDSLLH